MWVKNFLESLNKPLLIWYLLSFSCVFFYFLGSISLAEQSVEVVQTTVGIDQAAEPVSPDTISANPIIEISLNESDIIKNTRSLKNVIEENERLAKKTSGLEQEIQRLGVENAEEENRLSSLVNDKEKLEKENVRIARLNQKYNEELSQLKSELEDYRQETEMEVRRLGDELTVEKKWHGEMETLPIVTQHLAHEKESETQEMLMKLGQLDPSDEKFKTEAAKVHYNMGNIFFQRGEYKRSVVEYFQAVSLLPYDPEAHFNLAYVSAEYLGDYLTALKHYQKYIYLKPNAEDVNFVKEKILDARLHLKSHIDSPLEKYNKSEDNN